MKAVFSVFLALGFLTLAQSMAAGVVIPPARGISTHVLVVHGELISSKGDRSFPLYRIIAVRGATDAHEVAVFSSLEGYESALPTNAIMLLDGGAAFKKPEDGRIFLPLLSRDPQDALFTYTPESWTELSAKSDADLADSPMEKQMPMCDALKAIYPIVRAKHAGQELFVHPPHRVPFGWRITVFRVNGPYINDDHYSVMDSGKVFHPAGHCGLLVKPKEDVSTPEKIDAYLRKTYRDRPERRPRRFEDLCPDGFQPQGIQPEGPGIRHKVPGPLAREP